MEETTITVATRDGIDLQVYRWAPEGEPRAVVQVQHGLAEHAARYRRFAEALTGAGYLVYGPDGRGSGRTASGDYGAWGEDGWAGWVSDLDALNQRIRQDNPGLPVALFGHSMGSFAAQEYLLDHADDVDAAILSGTGEPVAIAGMLGSDGPTDLSAFNSPFEQRTGFEWLSRDEDEVDAYVADPMCGWAAPSPAGMASLARAGDPDLLRKIRKDLPVLLVSGRDDPVGGDKGDGVAKAGERYREAGFEDVDVRLYPAARHELLNETNRDEVTSDILTFLDRTVGEKASG
ncbi:MAG TPA: alpha/beta hydrolase [Propionibacterium sp.]|nr:alpha/beta hydrolase [Propionibacterium sp.]